MIDCDGDCDADAGGVHSEMLHLSGAGVIFAVVTEGAGDSDDYW